MKKLLFTLLLISILALVSIGCGEGDTTGATTVPENTIDEEQPISANTIISVDQADFKYKVVVGHYGEVTYYADRISWGFRRSTIYMINPYSLLTSLVGPTKYKAIGHPLTIGGNFIVHHLKD